MYTKVAVFQNWSWCRVGVWFLKDFILHWKPIIQLITLLNDFPKITSLMQKWSCSHRLLWLGIVTLAFSDGHCCRYILYVRYRSWAITSGAPWWEDICKACQTLGRPGSENSKAGVIFIFAELMSRVGAARFFRKFSYEGKSVCPRLLCTSPLLIILLCGLNWLNSEVSYKAFVLLVVVHVNDQTCRRWLACKWLLVV